MTGILIRKRDKDRDAQRDGHVRAQEETAYTHPGEASGGPAQPHHDLVLPAPGPGRSVVKSACSGPSL